MSENAVSKINILFLCTGNTCRSPIAKVLFEDMLSRGELRHRVRVESAGTMAAEGGPASPFAVEVCRGHGLELSSHNSKTITDKLIADSDLIIVMQASHQDYLTRSGSVNRKKIRLLSEFATGGGKNRDIEDPFGGTKEQYELTFTKIKNSLEGLLVYLTEMYDL
jgi:protein-tyrosine-phosphatase